MLFLKELSEKYTLLEIVPLLSIKWAIVVYFLVLWVGKALDVRQADDVIFNSLLQECGDSFHAVRERW